MPAPIPLLTGCGPFEGCLVQFRMKSALIGGCLSAVVLGFLDGNRDVHLDGTYRI